MRSLAVLFLLAWLVLAFFDLNFDREIFTADTAYEVEDNDPNSGTPELSPRAITEYRVQKDTVTSRTGGFITKYENCDIFDRNNWHCTYSDESGTFGANRGVFFSQTNLEKFPQLAYLPEEETLSRFRYILLQCRWDVTGGFDLLGCLLRPFTI